MILLITLLVAVLLATLLLWHRTSNEAESRGVRVRSLEADLAETTAKAEGLEATLRAVDFEAQSVRELNASLMDRNAKLGRFEAILDATEAAARSVADAERKAADLIARAKEEADSIGQAALEIIESAKAEAEDAKARTAQETRDSHAKAESLIRAADVEAQRLISDAKEQAKAVAGDALAAVNNARQLEQVAKAMKNVIEGYGDRYVIPVFGLLDELGDRFGHMEAGQMLKSTRERVRSMIKDGGAATCDYVEETRRKTAISFVVDAFNGKADSILGNVRHDNLGTLDRRLRDAFILVNQNGAAFRNARIEDRYLEARRDELRWAVAVHELKEREREEQRALRERIREEQQAQRDYERAIRDAAKEEGSLRKVMDRMKRQMEAATEEQKASYEAQLSELTEKLRLMEEKNQRALSMAQQTKSGHVYVISNIGSFGEDVLKIGMTRRLEPLDRVRELGDASVPFAFDVHAMIQADDAPAFETALHRMLMDRQVNKVNPRKEFFRINIAEIRSLVEGMGVQASWTMTAECKQYKESQAFERDLAEGKINMDVWRSSQIHASSMLTDEVEDEGDDSAGKLAG